MIEVHWASGSCNSWCVLLALAVKRVPYASKLLQLSKKEHKTAEYLALNPRGKVPCIRDGEFVLYESLAIIAYLDRKYPDPPLYGETPAEAGLVARLLAEDRFYLEPKLDALLVPFYRGKAGEIVGELPQRAAALHEELGRLEALLGQGDYLAGPRLSAADLSVFRTYSICGADCYGQTSRRTTSGFRVMPSATRASKPGTLGSSRSRAMS